MKSKKRESDFQRGVELFLRIARKRMTELQAQNITVRELIDNAVVRGRLEKDDAITPSYLSRILAGKLCPKTEETYDKISALLDIPTLFDVRSFLLPHDKKVTFIGKGETDPQNGEWLEVPFEGIIYRTPKANIIDSQMCPFILDLEPGEKTKKGKFKTDNGEEIAVLLTGEEFTLKFEDGEEIPVRKGEAVHFLASRPHFTENTGKVMARIMVIRSDPSLYRVISDAFRHAAQV